MFRFSDNVRTYVLETEYFNINQSCEHSFLVIEDGGWDFLKSFLTKAFYY